MATIRTGKTKLKMYIDGIPVENLANWSAERDTYGIGPFISEVNYYRAAYSEMKLELFTTKGTSLSFTITEGNLLQTEDGIYIQGPLRELFPSLFEGKDLLAWQLAYLEFSNENKAARFMYQRDNEYFTTTNAIMFQAGYERAYAAGYSAGQSKGYEKGRKDETEYQAMNNRKKRF